MTREMVFELLQLLIGHNTAVLIWMVNCITPCAVYRYRACSRLIFALNYAVRLRILDKRCVVERQNIK
jgi:hypothetical protein